MAFFKVDHLVKYFGGLAAVNDVTFEVGQGEIFGLMSVMGGDITRLDVTAVEDTICYSVPGTEVQRLLTSNAEVAGYLLRTSVQRYMDRSLGEIRARARSVTDGEKLLYSLSVGDILRKSAVTCPEMTPIQRAAQLMTSEHATCIFVVDRNGVAVGIVTDEDFAKRVVAPGLSLDTPVKQVMSAPVVSVDRAELIFQVLLLMLSHHIHHVLVTEDGLPKWAITNHDLMLLQGKSPLNVARHVDAQHQRRRSRQYAREDARMRRVRRCGRHFAADDPFGGRLRRVHG